MSDPDSIVKVLQQEARAITSPQWLIDLVRRVYNRGSDWARREQAKVTEALEEVIWNSHGLLVSCSSCEHCWYREGRGNKVTVVLFDGACSVCTKVYERKFGPLSQPSSVLAIEGYPDIVEALTQARHRAHRLEMALDEASQLLEESKGWLGNNEHQIDKTNKAVTRAKKVMARS